MIVQIFFFNLQNSPTFYSEERLVNLARGREFSVGLTIFFVYADRVFDSTLYLETMNLHIFIVCTKFFCDDKKPLQTKIKISYCRSSG